MLIFFNGGKLCRKKIILIFTIIEHTNIYTKDENGNQSITTIEGGYLDIGLMDTMSDLIVNFIGAVTFSIIGLLYIKNKEEYKFAENFIPVRKSDSDT